VQPTQLVATLYYCRRMADGRDLRRYSAKGILRYKGAHEFRALQKNPSRGTLRKRIVCRSLLRSSVPFLYLFPQGELTISRLWLAGSRNALVVVVHEISLPVAVLIQWKVSLR
jgi:hypothetical protein